MIFKDTIIYNALGFQYTGNLNNKRHINLSLTAYIKRRFNLKKLPPLLGPLKKLPPVSGPPK
jgi:hypothetical protein